MLYTSSKDVAKKSRRYWKYCWNTAELLLKYCWNIWVYSTAIASDRSSQVFCWSFHVWKRLGVVISLSIATLWWSWACSWLYKCWLFGGEVFLLHFWNSLHPHTSIPSHYHVSLSWLNFTSHCHVSLSRLTVTSHCHGSMSHLTVMPRVSARISTSIVFSS